MDFGSFEELYKRYIVDLNEAVYQVYCERAQLFTEDSRTWCEQPPCTVVSIFEQGCIDKGLSYIEGGPVYNVNSPHIGGLPDTVNSLYAIKKLVFDEKKVTFKELMELLRHDWEGNEALRRYVFKRVFLLWQRQR